MLKPQKPAVVTETDLIAKISRGDTRAFEKLYHLYGPQLYLNILKMVKDESIAEELVQELFTKVWQKRSNLQVETEFLSYLYRMAQNLVHDFFRKLQRDRKMLDHFKRIATENYDHVEAALFYKESEQLLHTALAQLSPQQRTVYQCCKINGYTYKQTAEEMGISPHTVKEYLQKANSAVKIYLSSNLDITFGLLILFWFK